MDWRGEAEVAAELGDGGEDGRWGGKAREFQCVLQEMGRIEESG